MENEKLNGPLNSDYQFTVSGDFSKEGIHNFKIKEGESNYLLEVHITPGKPIEIFRSINSDDKLRVNEGMTAELLKVKNLKQLEVKLDINRPRNLIIREFFKVGDNEYYITTYEQFVRQNYWTRDALFRVFHLNGDDLKEVSVKSKYLQGKYFKLELDGGIELIEDEAKFKLMVVSKGVTTEVGPNSFHETEKIKRLQELFVEGNIQVNSFLVEDGKLSIHPHKWATVIVERNDVQRIEEVFLTDVEKKYNMYRESTFKIDNRYGNVKVIVDKNLKDELIIKARNFYTEESPNIRSVSKLKITSTGMLNENSSIGLWPDSAGKFSHSDLIIKVPSGYLANLKIVAKGNINFISDESKGKKPRGKIYDLESIEGSVSCKNACFNLEYPSIIKSKGGVNLDWATGDVKIFNSPDSEISVSKVDGAVTLNTVPAKLSGTDQSKSQVVVSSSFAAYKDLKTGLLVVDPNKCDRTLEHEELRVFDY